ncbi:hypothetical protein AKG39_00685 [Acetobacterium bakii]|uniref:Uncharacterized protein n=1 Tax=Acetobacterium bakii TaxID=52689 RepID=A0A0L6U4L8_9FIRM|nr:hypothetical protein AKG39_00685 [Acetobacterium bakii]
MVGKIPESLQRRLRAFVNFQILLSLGGKVKYGGHPQTLVGDKKLFQKTEKFCSIHVEKIYI